MAIIPIICLTSYKVVVHIMSTQVALQYSTWQCLCLKSIQIQVHGQYINVSMHSCAKVNRLCFLYFSLVRVIMYVSNIVSVDSMTNKSWAFVTWNTKHRTCPGFQGSRTFGRWRTSRPRPTSASPSAVTWPATPLRPWLGIVVRLTWVSWTIPPLVHLYLSHSGQFLP